LTKVENYGCSGIKNKFVSLDLAAEVCNELSDCKGVYNKQCQMQEVGGVFGLCRSGEWLQTTGDCVYMKMDPTTAKPSTTTAKPGTTTAKPGTTAKLGNTTAKPGTTTGKPGTTTAQVGGSR